MVSDTADTDRLLTLRAAAEYCRVPLTWFRNQVKKGTGPAYVMPSPHARFFDRMDLDRWMEGWRRSNSTPEFIC